MTTETYQDLTFERKGQKRPTRPKLLKLTEVTMPHRNRKKTKLKVKERSQSNVRDRFYDDPAYTDDISHLALPLRRNSGPDKIEASGTFNKRKTTKDQINIQPYPKPRAAEPLPYPREHERDAGSSSSENGSHEYDKIKHGKSLEISHSKMEHSPKKREKRDRSAKQKRNLSLDNNLSNSLRRSLERSEPILKMASIDRKSLKQQPKSLVQRQNASESWNSCIAVTSDSSKATENDESFSGSVRKESKMQIGKKFLRGEIGIKSFNYYLLKEGLKSSKKFVEKKRNSLTWGSDSKKLQSRSEENIYEEIFFVDKSSDNDDHHNKYDDCELCMQECNKENCEYCFQDKKSKKHYFGSLGRHDKHPVYSDARKSEVIDDLAPSIPVNAHILEFQSYNPNNPGVYKIETTPVAFTSDYNPISSFEPISNTTSIIETNIKQISNYARPSIQSQYQQTFPSQSISAYQVPSIQQQQQQQQLVTQQLQQQQLRRVRDTRPNIQTTTTRITAKSSSSSDSLHHKYASKSEHQPIAITTIDSYEYNPRLVYGSNSRIGNGGNLQPSQIIYQEPKIYKSDSKASILSEYSIRSESSNRNFRCGEVSDSSLGDSMFSYSTQQKKYFGSSESCRFGFECRRCSLDGEKCSFSDTCRYECRNCDCSSSYFSSDFDDLNYNNPHRRSLNVGSGNTSHSNQRSYEYFNDAFDVKQSKYAQDFFKHVNDVKRSIYQAEIEGSSNKFLGNNNDPFAPIPSSKPSEMKKSLTSDMYGRQEKPAYHYPGEIILNRNTSGGSPYKSSTISHYASTQIFAPSSSSYVNSSSRSKDSGDYKYKSTTKDYRSMQNNISKSLDEQENSISSLKRISKSKQSEYNDRNLNDPEEKYKSLTKSLDKKLLYAQPYRKTKKDLQEDEIIHDRKTTTGAIPKLQSNESPIMHHRTQQQSKSHYAATVNNKISEYETPFTKTPSIKYAEPKSQTNYVSPRKSSRSIERSSGKTTKEGKIYQKSNIKSTAEIGRYLEKSQKEGQRRAKSLEKTLQKTPSDERNYNEISNKQTNRNIEESTLTKNKTDKKDKSEKIYKDNSSHSNQKKGAPKLIKTTQSLNEVVRDDVLDDEDDDVFYDAKGEESVSRSNSMRKNLKAVSPPCVPPTSPINSSNADINKNTITNDKNSSNKKDFKNSPTNQNLSISKNKTEKQDQNETQESTISKLPISSTQKINTPNTNLELNETKKEKPLKDNENLNTTTTTATTVTKSLDNKEQTPNEENINERKLQQLSIKDNSLKDTLKYAQDEILSPKDKSLNENTKNIKECNKSSKKEKTENEENSEQKSSSNNINSVQQHQQPKSTKDRSISEKAQQQQQLQQNNVSGKNIKQSPQKIHQINNEQNVDKQIDTQKNHNDKEKIPNNDKNQQNISTMNTNIENVAKQENENISIQNNNTITTTITTIISTDNNLPSTSKIESTIEKIPLKQIEVDIKSLPPPPSPIITTDEIKEVSDTNNVNNDNNIDTNSVTINTNATIASATITVTDTANITATNDNNTTTTSIIGTSVAIAATAAASTVIPIAVTTNLSADEEFSLTKTTTAVGNKLNRYA
ncbi:uncharacterized protein DDB_G0287625-like [Condylostylus longicornis]|uniref:uncharacterized protein DDB_G0287625-like n=1 Tax=Condylostylus longicornis TaxID=2530218 RepID=UPI00244DBEA3|nr:uncharacterized protein DDB_G0287625-like [Condylostylus longicornis]XP_055377070.1 uncharacterized protein DDB_G0287625-like [Condylostylus longicornis]